MAERTWMVESTNHSIRTDCVAPFRARVSLRQRVLRRDEGIHRFERQRSYVQTGEKHGALKLFRL